MPTPNNEFPLLGDDTPSSIVWAGEGGEGSGKSDFALQAPTPIWVAAFDAYGMNRVRKPIKTGRDIRRKQYQFSPNDGAKKALEIWNEFLRDYESALKDFQTLIVDREDLMWEVLRFAKLGAKSAAPSSYEELNLEYADMIQNAYDRSRNLGLLRGVKEKWVSKFDAVKGKLVPMNTGEMIPDGCKRVPDHVDIVLKHSWDDVKKDYMIKFDKFPNKEQKGKTESAMSWAEMALMAYPESDVMNWMDR